MPENTTDLDAEPVEPTSPSTEPPHGNSRRTFLKRAGLGVALVGLGVVADETARGVTAPSVPPRTAVTATNGVRIDDVTVIDPVDGSRRSGQSIIVRDGRIADVIPATAAPDESSLRTIDGADRFAVPGYNDMHTHVLQSATPELGFALMLSQGITGIRQMEGTDTLLTNRAENRLGLDETAPQLLQLPGSLLLPFNANSIPDARAEIARQWDQGADFIKMVLTDRDVFYAAITPAHERGLRIAGHLPPPVHIDEAAEGGIDSIEHLGTGSSVFLTLSTESDELWAQTTAVPDLGSPHPVRRLGLRHVPEEELPRRRHRHDERRSTRPAEAGIRDVLGRPRRRARPDVRPEADLEHADHGEHPEQVRARRPGVPR